MADSLSCVATLTAGSAAATEMLLDFGQHQPTHHITIESRADQCRRFSNIYADGAVEWGVRGKLYTAELSAQMADLLATLAAFYAMLDSAEIGAGPFGSHWSGDDALAKKSYSVGSSSSQPGEPAK